MRNRKKMGTSSELSQFYSTFVWPDDPENERGQRYFERTAKFMEILVNHSWMKEIISKKEDIRILEICGGVGFGGIALSKILIDTGVNVHLLITDLRKNPLDIAKRWGRNILGREVETSVIDAREVWKLKERFDISLIYGLSTPHFSPWDIVKLFASVSEILADDGLFILDESDRRYRIFLNQGYKWALAEGEDEDRFVVSFHTGYDPIKGTCKRSYINLSNPSKPVTTETFMWGLAEVGALMWTFFNDVDLVNLIGVRYFILGSTPRRGLKPQDLKEPTVIGNHMS